MTATCSGVISCFDTALDLFYQFVHLAWVYYVQSTPHFLEKTVVVIGLCYLAVFAFIYIRTSLEEWVAKRSPRPPEWVKKEAEAKADVERYVKEQQGSTMK
jgi:hypothetical protein